MAKAMDISKLLIANSEFGQKLDSLFNGLAQGGSIPQDVAAAISGMATAWSAISNSNVQEIATQMGIRDIQIREQQEEIKTIYDKCMVNNGGSGKKGAEEGEMMNEDRGRGYEDDGRRDERGRKKKEGR